jgi:hypothetical protein
MVKDALTSIYSNNNRQSKSYSRSTFYWVYINLTLVMMLCIVACEPTAEDLPLPMPECLNIEKVDRLPLLNKEDAQFMNGHWEIFIHTCNDNQVISGLEQFIHIESDLLILDVQGGSLLLKLPNPQINQSNVSRDLLSKITDDGEPLLIDVEIGKWIIGQTVQFRLYRDSQEDTQKEFPEDHQSLKSEDGLFTIFTWTKVRIKGVDRVVGMEGFVSMWLQGKRYELPFSMGWLDL